MTGLIEEVLRTIDVRIVSVGDQIKAYCPVHRLTVGREDAHPSWYMDAESGAALCFSCGWKGNLTRLIEDLELDVDLDDVGFDIMVNQTERLQADELPEEEDVYVSDYAFSKNPYPSEKWLKSRRIDKGTAMRLNIRWSIEEQCFLLPVYDFNGKLLGWQEKAKGHFNNVPARMRKRKSLFGYDQSARGSRVFVVESPLDAALILRYGHHAVATYGSFVSDEQINAMRRFKQIVLAFDQDDAGEEATTSVAERLQRQFGIDPMYLRYPRGGGKDPGECRALDLRVALSRPLPVPPALLSAARSL